MVAEQRESGCRTEEPVSYTHLFNLPTLFMESDMADSREFSEAQIFSQIDAFIETIEARKRNGK